jgi:hypothetical protein
MIDPTITYTTAGLMLLVIFLFTAAMGDHP